MLELKIPIGVEEFDDETQSFILPEEKTLKLEHSLVSISKWESKWCKPFLSKQEKTPEETLDYIKCMTVTPNVDESVYENLTQSNINQINKYIEAPMTATWFAKEKPGRNTGEQVTSELIYYWMIALNIPIEECQKWHLNRLLMLIKVCNIKNQPAKKMGRRDIMSRNAALNAARRQSMNSKG